MNGVYKHFKGGMYEVTGIGVSSKDGASESVIYKSLKDGTIWLRPKCEFNEKVMTHNSDCPVEMPRFELIAEIGTQRQLFAQTLRENRMYWFKALIENPAYKVNGEGFFFLYNLGDKVSFALSIRIITKSEAKAIIGWINKWATTQDKLLDMRGTEWEEYCVQAGRRLAVNQERQQDDGGGSGSSDGNQNHDSGDAGSRQ